MKNIAIFASGSGTNAQNIIEFFNFSGKSGQNGQQSASVKIVICNKPEAYVLTRAKNLNMPAVVLKKEELTTTPQPLLDLLKEHNIHYIILAGYLLKIPSELINEYPDRIINIHPALLPSYGGKGMYGDRIHEAVIAAGDKESGITIHLVDEKYDNGRILFQAHCDVEAQETPQSLAAKIHSLEYEHFPRVIEEYISTTGI